MIERFHLILIDRIAELKFKQSTAFYSWQKLQLYDLIQINEIFLKKVKSASKCGR